MLKFDRKQRFFMLNEDNTTLSYILLIKYLILNIFKK